MEGPAESRTLASVLRLAHVPSWRGRCLGENVIQGRGPFPMALSFLGCKAEVSPAHPCPE